MAADLATLTVAAQPSRVGTCELCQTEAVVLATAATVRHRRGGTIQLAACDHCARALHRLAAALGAGAVVEAQVVETVVVPAPGAAPPRVAEAVVPAPAQPRLAPSNGPPQLISQLASEVVSADGRHWTVRVFGEPRADGTWVGWIEFSAVGHQEVMRTRQETSQPDRGALAYWAGGLQSSYLEGAFSRAR